MLARAEFLNNGHVSHLKKHRQPPPIFSSKQDIEPDESAGVCRVMPTGRAANNIRNNGRRAAAAEAPPVSRDAVDLAAWVLTDTELELAIREAVKLSELSDDSNPNYQPDDGWQDEQDAADDLAEHFEMAVHAMLTTSKQYRSHEGSASAQKRLQEVCDIAVLYDLQKVPAMNAVMDYEVSFPFPGGSLADRTRQDELDIEEYLHRAETRVKRGAALLPTGVEIVLGKAGQYGKRTVVAKLGKASHTDLFDSQEDSRVVSFSRKACEKFDLKWAEEQVYQLVLKEAGREATKRQVEKYEIGQLLQKYPRRRSPVIDGLAREGETLNFISFSKIGKSWQCCQLALSIVTGVPWLWKFPVARGRVLIVDNELSRDEIAHRLRVVAKAMGIELDDLTGQIEIWSLREHPRSLEELQADFDAILPGTFRLIILDAEYKFLPPGVNENDNSAIALFHGHVTSIASRLGAVVALVHHVSKGPQDGKRLTDIGSGAGAQSRAVDCHLVLQEHENADTVVLRAAVRSFPPVEPLALKLEFPLLVPVDGVDASQLKVQPTAQDKRQEAKDLAGMEAILVALKKGPATARQLRPLTGLGESRIGRLLDLLVHGDAVTAKKINVRGNKTWQYSLTTTSK